MWELQAESGGGMGSRGKSTWGWKISNRWLSLFFFCCSGLDSNGKAFLIKINKLINVAQGIQLVKLAACKSKVLLVSFASVSIPFYLSIDWFIYLFGCCRWNASACALELRLSLVSASLLHASSAWRSTPALHQLIKRTWPSLAKRQQHSDWHSALAFLSPYKLDSIWVKHA